MHLLLPWRLEFHQGQTCLPCQACRRAAGVEAPRTSFSPRRRLAQAARGLAAPRAFCQLPPAMFPSLPGLPARGAALTRQACGSFRFRASRWQDALPASLLTPKGAGTQPLDRGQAQGRPGTDNPARLRRKDAGNGRTAGSLSLRPGPEAGSMPSAWTMPSRRTRRAFHAPLLLPACAKAGPAMALRSGVSSSNACRHAFPHPARPFGFRSARAEPSAGMRLQGLPGRECPFSEPAFPDALHRGSVPCPAERAGGTPQHRCASMSRKPAGRR
jgi:hypothetical protein